MSENADWTNLDLNNVQCRALTPSTWSMHSVITVKYLMLLVFLFFILLVDFTPGL
jgi:hypothetical protein